MKYSALFVILLALPGCARSITYTYYAGSADPASFSREAEQECSKYAMKSIFVGSGLAGFGRSSQTYQCIPN